MKRMISLLAALCLLLTMLPLPVWAKSAAESKMPERPVQINFQQPQVLGLEKLEVEPLVLPGQMEPLAEDYVSVEEGIVQMREQMMQRNGSIKIKVKSASNDPNAVFHQILDGAMAHTGQPGAGDNLQWQRGVIYVGDGFSYYYSGGYYYYTMPYDVDYYTTAAQEAELDAAVDELMEEWAYLEGKTDKEKVDIIYDYITSNVVYDYEHLSDTSYELMFTGYAAMIDGAAVCQGYANLFYRLALELGVDSRIVVGKGWTGSEWGSHAWNLVEIDGTYYYLDSTWDASYAQAGYPYQWYLKGSAHFGQDHAHDPNWVDWLPDYNISITDYESEIPVPDPDIEWPVSGTCGDHLTWSLAEDGMLTISGTGSMWDYPEEYPGWYQYADWVLECVIEEGVTTIGSYAFFQCEQLTSVTIGDSVTSIDYGAFARCYDLTSVTIGSGVTFIDEAAFYDCMSLTSAAIPEGITSISNDTFGGCYSLTSVTIPASVTAIGEGAFYECLKLEDVYYGGTEEQWGRVSIDEWNDPLLDATIYFGDPAPAISSGDANGDGEINILDVVALRQYLADWEVSIDLAGADADGSGTVNALDVILLRQYIADWDVTLGPKA